MDRLKGKVAIVTGAGSGIGEATAIMFAKEGAKVVVVDLIKERGEETVKTIRKAGHEATFCQADVSKAGDARKMVETAVRTYGKLDVLFNNAAIVSFNPLVEETEEAFANVMNVNVKGVWLGMKYAIPEMAKAGGGSIINTASIAADKAQLGLGIYAASKGGVISLSRVAAMEAAPYKIRVNVVKPGPTMTSMFLEKTKDNPGLRVQNERETPLGKMAKPEEIASAVLFLASDEASHVTAVSLTVDGGVEGDNRRIL